ncbi:hypothetical protein RB195_023960 [Necator americanus]|uniref:Uncharacterized protein n=1 Tax=Necator americanus TaxID=51031 RepID=A0ABR1ELA1_NECAM
MKHGSKAQTVPDVDNAVCAAKPDREKEPNSYEAVTTHMILGKCGADDPLLPSMRDGKSAKRFPKQVHKSTLLEADTYPKCGVRNRTTAEINGSVYSDEWVVPTNLHLLTKFVSCVRY